MLKPKKWFDSFADKLVALGTLDFAWELPGAADSG